MKICFLNPWFAPYPGGIERRLVMVAAGLAARGHEVHVLCAQLPGTDRQQEMEGFSVTRVPSFFLGRYRPQFVYSGIRALGTEIKRIDPDVLDLHYRWAPDYAAAALLRLRTRPCVLTYHNGHGEGSGWMRPFSELNDRLYDAALRRFSAVVAVSQHVRRVLLDRLPGLEVTTIYNGVTLPSSPRLPATVPDRPYLLCVCRLVPTKGLHDLLAAIALCRDEFGLDDIRLRIVGLGPELDRLRRQAAALKLAEAVEFLGYLPDSEKDALVAGCRVFCMPSRNESFGMAAIEAMALHRPVVGCDVEGLPEAVGGGGILVRPGSPRELATALARLWADAKERQRLAESGFAHVQRFTWDRVVAETEQLFEHVVRSG